MWKYTIPMGLFGYLPKNWGSQTAVTMTCIFRISAFSWEVDATKEILSRNLHRLDVWNLRDPITSHWKPDATAQELHRNIA